LRLIDDLLESVAPFDCPVQRVCIGLHWTAVESRQVGMAHTFRGSGKYEIAHAGDLVGRSAFELANRLRSWQPLEASLGLAALNSMIEPHGAPGNIQTHLLHEARDKSVVIVGRFPFNEAFSRVAARIEVLEMDPQGDELPSQACEDVLPHAELAVISATALLNKTLSRLMELAAEATVVVLGPSTPMNNVLFRHGADVLAGVRVTDADALMGSLMQGVKKFGRLTGTEAIARFFPENRGV
jgi:uncharacterized protein (DUF4213/DUF364 family)